MGMRQNLIACTRVEDHLVDVTYLIHDRDAKCPLGFDAVFKSANIEVVKTPIMAPNANAFAEAWIATLKKECLGWFVCFSLKHLDYIVQTFVDYYNKQRPHQSMDNKPLRFPSEPDLQFADNGRQAECVSKPIGSIICEQELGGLLTYYRHAA